VNDLHGYLSFAGGDTWYRIAGGDVSAGTPLVLLHGGPGYPSYYLETLLQLARPDRAVIVYDQVSCGRSTGPLDPAEWTFELFVAQFEAVLDHFNVAQVDLLGHSWGGFLGLEIALRRPDLLHRLILASTSPSSRMFIDAAMARVATMEPDVIAAIELGESSGDYKSPEYQRANRIFLHEFCNRMDPLPPPIVKANESMNHEMYLHMWGPTEFRCTGSLGDWDASSRPGEIDLPVLITSGAYDEAGPAIQEFMLSHLPNALWTTFGNSAHHAEHSDGPAFIAAIDEFLIND